MSHSLPSQQQDEEMSEGKFDWKLERFLENNKDWKSSVFKFGRHNAFLTIPAKSVEYFTTLSTEHIHNYVDGYPKFEIELHIVELLGFDIFSNCTTCKVCLIPNTGWKRQVTSEYILHEESSFRGFTKLCGGPDSKKILDQIRAELLPGGTLSVCLTWYEKRNRIGPMTDIKEVQTSPNLIPDIETTKALLRLSEDFGRFFESKETTDFILRVDDIQIPVHRAVLSARSEVFAAMFRHDTSENRSGVADIQDVDATVLKDVLFYVYSGQIRGLSADTAAPMYVVTDKYAMIELKNACLDLLKSNLTVENVCDAALLAHTHGEADLEEKVVQFLEEKLEEVEENDKWKDLLKNKPSFVNKLLRSVVATCRRKMTIAVQ